MLLSCQNAGVDPSSSTLSCATPRGHEGDGIATIGEFRHSPMACKNQQMDRHPHPHPIIAASDPSDPFACAHTLPFA